MYIPGYSSSPTTDGGVLSGILLGRKTHTDTSTSSDPNSPTPRRTETITFLLPLVITGVFLLITVSTLLLARCLYRRFKATNVSPSPSSSPWKLFYSSRQPQDPSGHGSSYPHYDQEYLDSLDDEARGEYERLLARRRSTSYYDANRSRAPVPVVIRYDTKGRPISTWSTASSVAAARGEELSQWSRRRDDLIRIYGNSQRNSTLTGGFEDDLEEEPEPEEQEQEQEGSENIPSTSSGYYEIGGRGEYSSGGGDNTKVGHLAPRS
ncbi:hypothetical protein BG000_009755 [Podila horticola]|nr:hypothetical protein BG000_009755 [Podila horticola]